MYGFSINLKSSFDNAINQVTEALKKEGFGILTDIDVKATLKTSPFRVAVECLGTDVFLPIK